MSEIKLDEEKIAPKLQILQLQNLMKILLKNLLTSWIVNTKFYISK